MYKGGRRKDPVWDNFLEVKENGILKAKCKICGHIQGAKACRMRKHVESCQQRQTEVGKTTGQDVTSGLLPIPETVNEDNMGPDLLKVNNLSSTNSSISASLLKKRKIEIQNSISGNVIKTTSDTKDKLDKFVASFFFACNIPFSAVEHSSFKKLITALRPGYLPPSRKALSGKLLDDLHEEMQNKMKHNIEGKQVALMIDGWSNIHNDPINVTSVYCNEKVYFVEATDTNENKKTCDYLVAECQRTISNIKEKYGCAVTSCVTDNAKNMEKMRQKLAEIYTSAECNFVTYGCSAHWLNLLGQDITPTAITKQVVHLQKYFRNHHLPGAWLKMFDNSLKPQLPGDTRWNSQLTCMKTYLHNHSFYVQIANEHYDHEIDSSIVQVIRDFNLYHQAKDLVKQLEPIAQALDYLQSNTATIADACHTWIKLLNNPLLKPHEENLKKRFKQAILPAHMLAYLMHPKYKGSSLNQEQTEIARGVIEHQDQEMLPYVIAFELQTDPYPSQFFLNSM